MHFIKKSKCVIIHYRYTNVCVCVCVFPVIITNDLFANSLSLYSWEVLLSGSA